MVRNSNISDNDVNIGGCLISNLRYADDTALLDTNAKRGIDLLERVNQEGKEVGLRSNTEKTKVL